mmetsp:Transcript_18603/g.39125  ORF Transcript_18603/g.39125 Transcript_18603/m.39125 type:complete len:574 (+) Transcript_18603:66-1787(+)
MHSRLSLPRNIFKLKPATKMARENALLLIKIMSMAFFSFTLGPLKRVVGFGVGKNGFDSPQCISKIASRHQRRCQYSGYRDTRLFYITSNSQNKILGQRERIKAVFKTARRLTATGLQDALDAGENFEEEYAHDDAKDEADNGMQPLKKFLPSIVDGFFIVKTFKTYQDSEFDLEQVQELVGSDDISRLEMTPRNISVPVALMMLHPEEYPSKSNARKACRKGRILIHRGPLEIDEESREEKINAKNCVRARVGDRVFPGDVLCEQIRIADGTVPVARHQKPPFELPVVFEDDHFAIVNKPAGIVVYGKKGADGDGFMNIRSAIPFAVSPSKIGTYSTLRRPKPVHRLDKPTSGLLIVAKTTPAMVNLSQQFRERKIKKTYTAIVNGIPPEPAESQISAKEAHLRGLDVNPDAGSDDRWQMIDHVLDEKSAVTAWRAIKYSNSIIASENVLTTVELKPKTGRFHQLRRHMSWVCECPIIGDNVYDGGGTAMGLRREGLFLCSNRVTLEHPFYNDWEENGNAVLQQLSDKEREGLWLSPEGKVMVTVSIELPDKFQSFISTENIQYAQLLESED